MSDSCNITNPFQSLENIVAFSCRDWSANPEDAWIYGIINGWGFDEDDEEKSCTDELERKFGSNKWSKSDTKRLKVLHNNWKKAKELMAKYAKEKESDTKRLKVLHNNWKKLILSVTLVVLAIIFLILKNTEEKKAEQIAAEKTDQMYYEEMFPQLKMNLFARNPTIIIPAYDEKFILMQPELKKYFVRKVPAKLIFSTKLNIDFADGTWQLSVNKHTDEIVRAQFSKDGKYVLVSGIKEGNAVIDISREGEVYGGNIFVRVEEPEEWYEKLQEEIKLES